MDAWRHPESFIDVAVSEYGGEICNDTLLSSV